MVRRRFPAPSGTGCTRQQHCADCGNFGDALEDPSFLAMLAALVIAGIGSSKGKFGFKPDAASHPHPFSLTSVAPLTRQYGRSPHRFFHTFQSHKLMLTMIVVTPVNRFGHGNPINDNCAPSVRRGSVSVPVQYRSHASPAGRIENMRMLNHFLAHIVVTVFITSSM